MVEFNEVLASNSRISQTLPKGLVAVFAGATSGIGQATLKTLVQYAVEPRIYVFTRSTAGGERVAAMCKEVNPAATIIPVVVDLSSIEQTDRACRTVLDAEEHINLVFNSAGEVRLDKSLTQEGLHIFLACLYYSKLRMIQLFTPRLQAAAESSVSSFARIVAVAGGSREGDIDIEDLPALKMSLPKTRGHLISMITLSLEELAQGAPGVTFIHNYPGTVRTALFDKIGGIKQIIFKIYSFVGEWLGWPGHLSLDECGEREIFLATSAIYPPKKTSGRGGTAGVAREGEEPAMRGVDGQIGSGVYSVSWDGEPASAEVEALLRKYQEQGVNKIVWEHNVEQFLRVSNR